MKTRLHRYYFGSALLAIALVALILTGTPAKDFLGHCQHTGSTATACSEQLAGLKALDVHPATLDVMEEAYANDEFIFTPTTTDATKSEAFSSFMVCDDECSNRLAAPYKMVPLSACKATCLCAANSYMTSLALELKETRAKAREVLKHNLKVCIRMYSVVR